MKITIENGGRSVSISKDMFFPPDEDVPFVAELFMECLNSVGISSAEVVQYYVKGNDAYKKRMKKADFLVDSLMQDREVLERAYVIIRDRLARLTEFPSKLCHYDPKDDNDSDYGYCLLHKGNHERLKK